MSEQSVQAAIHEEVQRLQCLQALGITVYHPRFRLPGAKPSVQGIWPDADAATSAEADARTERARTAQSDESVAARGEAPSQRGETAAPRSERSRPSITPAEQAPVRDRAAAPAATSTSADSSIYSSTDSSTDSSTVETPRTVDATVVQNFQLLFLQIDDDLALLNQIPALARPQLQDRQLALLTNLLRWLGKPVPAQAPRMFRWPLPGLEHMVASMNPATSLLHFLEQASSERRFRFLLHLGPQAVTPASTAWQSFATHSLDELLALPSLKREAWETLLPLHALLHSAS